MFKKYRILITTIVLIILVIITSLILFNRKSMSISELETNKISSDDINTEVSKEIIHTHLYKLIETIESTCITQGKMTYKCECGEQHIEILPVSKHNYIEIDTDYEKFYKTYVCSICGESYKEEVTLHLVED